jgi:hypothetical protein
MSKKEEILTILKEDIKILIFISIVSVIPFIGTVVEFKLRGIW